MKPETLAKSGTESGEQRALMAWAALNAKKYPVLRWLHHVANGGARGNDSRTATIRGGALKAEGVKAGVFDLCLPVARGGYHGLYIEMKKPGKIKDTSPEQKEFGEFLTKQSYAWRVCDNWVMATETIEQYLNWNT